MKFIIALSLFLFVSCSKTDPVVPPVPPVPPVTTFTVGGSTVNIQGTLKPGAKVNVDQAKSALGLTVDLLDKK